MPAIGKTKGLPWNMLVGWVIEDCTVEILNKLGYNTSLNSADKHRKILLKPTADSDLKVYINGKDVLIEQVNDFTGYWKKTLHVPLRDNKYINLKNLSTCNFIFEKSSSKDCICLIILRYVIFK